MPIWNAEKIAGLTDTDLERLAANAARLKGEEVILLCEAELQKRNEIKFANRPQRVSPSKSGSYVSEFHFISPKESGIIRNPDGTLWSGTWVVAEDNAKDAVKYGSVVALHVSKREDSYLQGVVLDWRKSPRDPHYNSEIETKTDEGIDFLIKVDGVSLKWIGDGSGEKGYCWRPKPAA